MRGALAGLACMVSGVALAGDTHLDLMARTTVPLDVGARLQLEMPGRFRIGLDGGVVPDAYVDLMNIVVVAFGGYSEETGELIAASIDSSGVLGVDLGWRPWPEAGAQFFVGYDAIFAGGGLTGGEVIEAFGGPSLNLGSNEVPLSTTIHMVKTGISYEHVWVDHLVLRVDLGGAFTVHSKTRVGDDGSARSAFTASARDELARDLDEDIQAWFHTPLIGVSLGYRFF